MRSLIVLVASVVLALAVLTSDRYLPGLPEQPAKLPAAVVSLGDSTLSGEGGGHYEPGTNGEQGGNWCHRSPTAPINQLQLPPTVTRINLACSGAKTDAVRMIDGPEQSQDEQLAELARHYRITHVVVAIGANDNPDFLNAVNDCVEAWVRRSPVGCSAKLQDSWQQRIAEMQPKVLATLQDIRAQMNAAGYTPSSYQLILQSYASPVGPGIRPELQGLAGCPFQTGDMAWIRDTGVPQLSAGLNAVANQAGARFLDYSRAGFGHEACTGNPKTAEGEWFTRLTVDWPSLQDDSRAPHAMQESFHPNATGQAQFARCLGEFMATQDAQATCLPDDVGNLKAVPAKDTR